MNTNHDCRLLTLSDVDQAAQVISQAFIDDPLCTFMLPSRKTRLKTLHTFFRLYGEVNVKNQRGYGFGDPLEGVAYWKSPTQEEVSISVKALGKFLPLFFTPYPLGLIRARAITKQIDELHLKYAAKPHFYLDNIGVLASARGKGVASRLIRPFLETADAQGVIAYTDTVTRSNVPLYEHFGFQCLEECPIEGTGVTVWALRRPVQ
jgi:ribosomal protein S18 acetylase RimI-like enzyme